MNISPPSSVIYLIFFITKIKKLKEMNFISYLLVKTFKRTWLLENNLTLRSTHTYRLDFKKKKLLNYYNAEWRRMF